MALLFLFLRLCHHIHVQTTPDIHTIQTYTHIHVQTTPDIHTIQTYTHIHAHKHALLEISSAFEEKNAVSKETV